MKKKFKILLSAYACEPNTGSEPEIGWGWAKGLYKKGYDVSVITRESNRKKIEATMLQNPEIKIDFYYYDLNKIILKLIKGKSNSYSYFYFVLWQFGIYYLAKAIIKKKNIEIIHHVTFGSLRYPSFLGLLDVPLIFGPVGGGEKTPKYLKKSFNFTSKFKEFIRELSINYIKLSPLMNFTFYFSNKIYVATEESKNSIPKRYHNKTKLSFATNIDDQIISKTSPNNQKIIKKFKLLFIGRLIYWKGLHIVLKSFAKIKRSYPDVELVIRGDGPLEKELKEQAKNLKIQDDVIWLDKLSDSDLSNLYKDSDLLVFPSLHDSGGMVILEAMANGLPTATLNIGGPGIIVNKECGINIDTTNKTENVVIEDLSNEIIDVLNNKEKLNNLKKNCTERIKKFTWEQAIKNIYDII